MTANERKGKPASRPLQICIFDARRGNKEGEEADKALGYYPSNTSNDSQAAVIGLAQAAVAFASTFQPVRPCDPHCAFCEQL